MKRVVCLLGLCLALAVPALAQQGVVASVRGKYPTPLGTQHGAFLVEVACATGKGLLRKDWGTFVRLADGTGVAQDILMERNGVHYDILGDGEGRAIPNWDQVTDPPSVDPARYYAPSCGAAPPPPNDGPPSTPPDWLEDLLVAAANTENLLRAELAAIRQELAELKARQPPEYSATLPLRLGTLTLRPR